MKPLSPEVTAASPKPLPEWVPNERYGYHFFIYTCELQVKFGSNGPITTTLQSMVFTEKLLIVLFHEMSAENFFAYFFQNAFILR